MNSKLSTPTESQNSRIAVTVSPVIAMSQLSKLLSLGRSHPSMDGWMYGCMHACLYAYADMFRAAHTMRRGVLQRRRKGQDSSAIEGESRGIQSRKARAFQAIDHEDSSRTRRRAEVTGIATTSAAGVVATTDSVEDEEALSCRPIRPSSAAATQRTRA